MTAPRAIAFFPWWAVDEPMTVGPVRLLPFAKGQAPGELPHVEQRDIDAVIHAYATRPGQRLRKATLLEVDNWQLGQDPTPVLRRLFAAQEALGFAGLAGRSLFGGHFGYCCFHNFSLVVQRYQAGRGDTFAYAMRRRDGGSQHLWSSDEFAFQRPLHVDSTLKGPTIDADLVQLLMDETLPAHWGEAVAEYNRANTDSIDVPAHVEMVMMKSAFEQLLGIQPRADHFERALDQVLASLPPPPKAADGPLRTHWFQAFPRSSRLIHAWAREFCGRRGAAAHGSKGGDHFVWSEAAHLAFASLLFPLVLKKLATDAGRYSISLDDLDRLARIDEYIAHEPMSFREVDVDEYATRHPWLEIDLDIRMRAISRQMRPGMLAALEEGIAAANRIAVSPDPECRQ